MSFSQLSIKEETEVETVFVAEEIESSEDPPQDEWSSLRCLQIPIVERKRLLYEEGLYEPGSGEICTKYIACSDSSVFRHPYYKYPMVQNPGIEEALLQPIKQPVYADDGQELYLGICKEMGTFPVRIFYQQLFNETVNLRYYGVNPDGIRPMALALKNNKFVKVFDLTDNWINVDGCFHLGDMLLENSTLKELNLTGCRIGPDGAERLMCNIPLNRALCVLNLSKNQLGDEGIEYISKAIYEGADIFNLNLSYNNLTSKSALSLAEAFDMNNKLTHLDLSWNSLLSPGGVNALALRLFENETLVEVNLAWNSLTPRFTTAIKYILLSPNLQHLNLSNNNLKDEAINAIKSILLDAKKLEILNLSSNPITPADALGILQKLKNRKSKIKQLLLDNIYVNESFVEQRERILQLKHKKGAIITYGEVKPSYELIGGDMREIVLKRAEALCSKPKKKAVDIGVIILTLHRHQKEPLAGNELNRLLIMNGAFQLNDDLIEEMVRAFPGPKKGKFRTIDLNSLVDYIHRKWPDKEAIKTPPPEPEPEPKPKKGDKKGKKK